MFPGNGAYDGRCTCSR